MFEGMKVTRIEVSPSAQATGLDFHLARIDLDPDRHLILRYEAYVWPATGDEPVLEEQYVYRSIELNVGLTEQDFDSENPEYQFP